MTLMKKRILFDQTLIFANMLTNKWSCGGQTRAMNIDHHNFSLPLPIQGNASYLLIFISIGSNVLNVLWQINLFLVISLNRIF